MVCRTRIQMVAVQLLIPLEDCIRRVQQRIGHPTLTQDEGDQVCRR